MTREEAKEILTHNWTRVDNPNYSESELDEAFFMAIEALHREEAEAKGYCHRIKPKQDLISREDAIDAMQWIPCSERLPKKDELVLVTVWNDVVIAWRNRYGGWESVEDMYENGDVIAWMPLPKPYRKDGEEE